MHEEIIETLRSLTRKKISYLVLRDFIPLNRINESLDIDILIKAKDLKRIQKDLLSDGWQIAPLNINKISHYQYQKIINRKRVKLDFVTDLYYGDRNYHFKTRIRSVDKDGVTVADPKLAIETMVLHIVFDKGQLSEKNEMVLRKMLEERGRKDKEREGVLIQCANEIIDEHDKNKNVDINRHKKTILSNNLLKKSRTRNLIFALKNIACKVLNKIYLSSKKRSIAFIGVDGAGKSSAVEAIKKIYADDARIVYMGLKEFKSRKLAKILESEKKNGLNAGRKILKKILLLKENIKRVYRYRFRRYVVIYDRYLEDYYACPDGMFHIIDKLFYKILLPKPKMKFYFMCSVKTSLSRKDDIGNPEDFKKKKEDFDEAILKEKSIFVINTDRLNEEQVIEEICNKINDTKGMVL